MTRHRSEFVADDDGGQEEMVVRDEVHLVVGEPVSRGMRPYLV
jgi:hypothetical protein